MKHEAMHYDKLEGGQIHCHLCSHRCLIPQGGYGICRVRQNQDGRLYTLFYGETVSANVDPVEKQPLFHFLPGSRALSVAIVGCNFQCAFCQNWQVSQAARDACEMPLSRTMTPQQVVMAAKQHGCRCIAYTYTEPTVFFEYAYDIARLARKEGISNVFVTNGYMSRQATGTIAPYLDAVNVDLKSFSDIYYSKVCKARRQPVLDFIASMKSLGIWLEVTTLLISGENDSDEEIRRTSAFIAGIDENIPWHLIRFYPEYRFASHSVTSIEALRRARKIGVGQGLRHVYLGNVNEGSDTYCPNCRKLLLKRSHFEIGPNHLAKGCCPSCGTQIAGIWR